MILIIVADAAAGKLARSAATLEQFPPKLTHTPLMPAKAGIQFFGQSAGSPLARPREGGGGDERRNRTDLIQPENAL
jgi:hypothetical protein